MLVHRFGILRKAFPVNVSISKTNSAVLALCKLHNFCIDSNHEEIGPADIGDTGNIMMEGGMVLPRIDNVGDYFWDYDTDHDRLDEVLDGGDHYDDHSRDVRRRFRRLVDLPIHLIHQHVIDSGARRPERNNRRRRRSV